MALIFGAYLFWAGTITIGTVYLLLYLVGCLALANTAHEGGRLVHHFGVLAPIDDPRQ